MDIDTAELNSTKASACQQQLLGTDCLDLKIVQELGQFKQDIEISTIEQQLDLVNSILQLNYTSSEFDIARVLVACKKDYQTLTDRLLKYYSQVVVLESLQTSLLTEAHCQIASAHLGTKKTKQIIQACYYQYKIDNDIK